MPLNTFDTNTQCEEFNNHFLEPLGMNELMSSEEYFEDVKKEIKEEKSLEAQLDELLDRDFE